MATIDTIIVDAGKAIRDALRSDSSLCTSLGITTATSKNYIFFLRPADQKEGFENPRIVIELKPSNIGNAGDNPDGQRAASLVYQISVWVNENPSMLILQVIEKIISILHNLELSVTNSFGLFKASSTESFPDPDKEGTVLGLLTVNFELCGGV
jgi:hypothetical protein